MAKKALILGVTGQDGAYLSRLLLDKGYEVYGTSRRKDKDAFWRLRLLDIENNIHFLRLQPTESGNVLRTIQQVNPDEIYHLSGQSSVALSYDQPQETMDSILMSTSNVLDAIHKTNKETKLFHACSGECFGATESDANEETPFDPVSPYAIAKTSAYRLVKRYREEYSMYACSGILFNHESPLRTANYVTRKITQAAAHIKQGKQKGLELGDLTIQRDWGYAPDYVEAMYLMLQQDSADDFVLATGQPTSIEQFCQIAFAHVDLDYRDFVKSAPKYIRANDKQRSVGNPKKAAQQLDWQAKTNIESLIKLMVEHDLT